MPPRKQNVKEVDKTSEAKSLPSRSASAGRLEALSRIPKPKNTPAKPSATLTAPFKRNSSTYSVPVLRLDQSQSALMEQYGDQPIHISAMQGNLREIQYHHRRGFPLDCHNLENSTPLMFACLSGQRDAARMLVEAGASKIVRDIFGHSTVDYTMDCRCMNQRRRQYSFARMDDTTIDRRLLSDSWVIHKSHTNVQLHTTQPVDTKTTFLYRCLVKQFPSSCQWFVSKYLIHFQKPSGLYCNTAVWVCLQVLSVVGEHFIQQIRRLLSIIPFIRKRSYAFPSNGNISCHVVCGILDAMIPSLVSAVRVMWKRSSSFITSVVCCC